MSSSKRPKRTKKPAKVKYATKTSGNSMVSDVTVAYRRASGVPRFPQTSFKVRVGGKEKSYSVATGYGYFISSFRQAANLGQVAATIDNGLPSRELQSIIEYLGFKVPEIAKAASVSASTVSRWDPDTSIGVPGANQFFKIDEVIRKGVALFGGEDEFKSWLSSPNMALGNEVPARLVTSLIGIELVDEAIDALNFGNVM